MDSAIFSPHDAVLSRGRQHSMLLESCWLHSPGYTHSLRNRWSLSTLCPSSGLPRGLTPFLPGEASISSSCYGLSAPKALPW